MNPYDDYFYLYDEFLDELENEEEKEEDESAQYFDVPEPYRPLQIY